MEFQPDTLCLRILLPALGLWAIVCTVWGQNKRLSTKASVKIVLPIQELGLLPRTGRNGPSFSVVPGAKRQHTTPNPL